MDLDSLSKQFQDFKRRVEPMVRDYEAHVVDRKRAETDAVDHGAAQARAHALEALDAGDLEEAGKTLNLSRSHDGDEPDDSYGRRLRAAIHGAEAAAATDARETDGDPDSGGDEGADEGEEDGTESDGSKRRKSKKKG